MKQKYLVFFLLLMTTQSAYALFVASPSTCPAGSTASFVDIGLIDSTPFLTIGNSFAAMTGVGTVSASECITTTTTTTTLSTETVNQLPANEKEVATALKSLCDSGDADTDLQARCDSLIADDISVQELTDAMRQVSSMQTSGQATSAIQMLDAYVNTLGSRTQQIRQGNQQGVRLTGLSIKDSHGKSLSTNKLAQINEYLNKGSAGDESEFDKLGFFMNGSYVFGKRDATDKELGFNEYGYSTTLGVDYRILDNLVLGVAFGYTYKNNSYIDSLGTMETDDFSGALYGTFYLDNGFYIDASVSGTSSNYQNQRNINYTANIGITGGEAVDTHTSGENNGHKYNINIASGYDFYMEGLRLSPQLKLNYSNVHIDDLYEQGGQGLALHIEDQDFDALSTSLGFQTSYPFSFSWGVLVPTLAVDWTHEFLYSARTIHANFIQDLGSSKTSFHIFTDNPDRDFVNVSAGASAQLKHGIAMFINYETILAHRHIDSHLFTAGVRIEF